MYFKLNSPIIRLFVLLALLLINYTTPPSANTGFADTAKIAPPSSRLLQSPQHPTDSLKLQVLQSANLSPETGPVTVISDNSFIDKPANYFNLSGKRLRLTPVDTTRYTVQVLPLDSLDPQGDLVSFDQEIFNLYTIKSKKATLPFAFPFGETVWTETFINLNGTLSFGQSEVESAPQRNSWADGTMRSVAAAIDTRAATGIERVIAALWAIYSADASDSQVYFSTTAQSFTVTWNVTRPTPGNGLYQPLGRSMFQAKLFSSGAIELAYEQIPERDGIVGIFPGIPTHGILLDNTVDTGTENNGGDPNTVVDVASMEVIDTGSVVQFRFTMNKTIPQNIPAPDFLTYRVFISYAGKECLVQMNVDTAQSGQSFCIAAPGITTFRVSGNTLDLFMSKVVLETSNTFTWKAEVVLWKPNGAAEFDQVAFDQPRTATLAQSVPFAFIGTSSQVDGNIVEVFHYPVVSKHPADLLRAIYNQYPSTDDIAIVLTDFRIDDLYGHGGSSTVNNTVTGIGVLPTQRSSEFGSPHLQVTMAPTYAGQPRFAESVSYDGHTYHGYAGAVGWISHEAIHRWAAYLKFRNSDGQVTGLEDNDCFCHWKDYLHVPSIDLVSFAYTDAPYAESSPMGGNVWQENADGTFTRQEKPYMTPFGLSALDLYVMGLIKAEEVPDTFVLSNPTLVNSNANHVHATKGAVRIQDIIAAMGTRTPTAVDAQKSFTFSVYLISEPGRGVNPDMLSRAEGISGAVAKYFVLATGGRMQVAYVPHADAPVANYGTSTTDYDVSISGTLSATDRAATALTYAIFSNGMKGVASITNPSRGTFIYTPNTGATGHDSFTFTATNSQGNSNTASITVMIKGSVVFLPDVKR